MGGTDLEKLGGLEGAAFFEEFDVFYELYDDILADFLSDNMRSFPILQQPQKHPRQQQIRPNLNIKCFNFLLNLRDNLISQRFPVLLADNGHQGTAAYDLIQEFDSVDLFLLLLVFYD